MFVADSISNHRKGFQYLKKAFEKMDSEGLVLCAIGNKNGALTSLNNIQELGHIYDERLMSIAYSAADVFVIPYLMDNLPLSTFLNTIDTFDCDKIRKDAVNKYDLEVQANSYIELFESILK